MKQMLLILSNRIKATLTFVLIGIHFIPYIGDPVLDMISQETGLILNNGGHHCENRD